MCAGMVIKTPFSKAFTWINIGVNSAIPFFTLMILNILIITTIRNRRKNFPGEAENKKPSANQEEMQGGQGKDSVRERNLTVMLMLVSFTLLALTMPMYIRLMVYSFVDTMSSVNTYALYTFMWNLTSKLFFTNNCCNFLLYCLGGTKFRQDLLSLFPCFLKSTSGKSRSLSSLATTVSVVSEKA